MLAFFFRTAQKQALTDGAPFQEPMCCPSASVDTVAPFVGIGFPNVGIRFLNCPKTSSHWWCSLARAQALPKCFGWPICIVCWNWFSECWHSFSESPQNKLSLVVLPCKSPSAAQVLPSPQLHRLLELVFRMLAFFFRIAPKQALIDGAPLQEPKCCPSASDGPSASFVGIGFPNVGILFLNRPKTSSRWWCSLGRAQVLPNCFR